MNTVMTTVADVDISSQTFTTECGHTHDIPREFGGNVLRGDSVPCTTCIDNQLKNEKIKRDRKKEEADEIARDVSGNTEVVRLLNRIIEILVGEVK